MYMYDMHRHMCIHPAIDGDSVQSAFCIGGSCYYLATSEYSLRSVFGFRPKCFVSTACRSLVILALWLFVSYVSRPAHPIAFIDFGRAKGFGTTLLKSVLLGGCVEALVLVSASFRCLPGQKF